mgnify:FL=1
MAVTLRPVDCHACIHQSLAGFVDIFDAVREMPEIAAFIVAALVPVMREFNLGILVARRCQKDQRIPPGFIVEPAKLFQAEQFEKFDRLFGVAHADHSVEIFHRKRYSIHRYSGTVHRAEYIGKFRFASDMGRVTRQDKGATVSIFQGMGKMEDGTQNNAWLTRFTANQGKAWLAGSALLATGLVIGGYLMGDGLVRMKQSDRAVTVRGLAERDATADLATWTIAYSAKAGDLQSAQAKVDNDTKAIRAFFTSLGFDAEALQPTGANVSQYNENGAPVYSVKQRLSLRTTDIKRAEAAVKRQFDLVKSGVELEEGSGMAYTFTKLNDIKPAMIAQATKDARKSAEQFANDSGTDVGSIKSATQGYFEVTARDGDSAGGWGVSDTPYKKVRVVTTVEYYLD